MAKVEAPALSDHEPVQLSSPPATPGPVKSANSRKRKAVKEEDFNGAATPGKAPVTPKSTKRARKSALKEEDINDLPHGLGAIPQLPSKEELDAPSAPAKRATKPKKATKATKANKEEVDDIVAKATTTTNASPKKTKKNNSYGVTPGQTPYPNYPHPTKEECEEVTRILSKAHGKVEAPKTVPPPSLDVAGCGEVPSVLDALIRTRLSAATTGTNSTRAFAGLVAKFGILQSGIGKGSVDWNAVRLADQKDVYEAIKAGGMGDVKSKDIKKILQMVWEENQKRKHDLQSSKAEAAGESNEPAAEKTDEIEKAEHDVVSLDHLHLLDDDDAFNALISYPGIGAKTASCVLLFCLQRASFAVDTHVFRLCKWLGWVPAPGDPAGLRPNAKAGTVFKGADRDSTFAHLQVRIPAELKYPLHQLFIRHGKSCPRCRAITGEGSAEWHKGCPIEHLVKRTGGRKGGSVGVSPAKGKKSKGRKQLESEDESEAPMTPGSDAASSELSGLVSDQEIEASEEEEEEEDSE